MDLLVEHGRPVPGSCLEQLGSPRLRATVQLAGLGVTADGADIVAATDERALSIFSAETGDRRLLVRSPERSVSSFHVAGRLALWGCHGQGAHVVDLDDGRVIRTLPHVDVLSVALSSDGRLAVTGGDRTVKQWDVATGKEGKKLGGCWDTSRDALTLDLAGLHDQVLLALSPDGSRALVSQEGEISLLCATRCSSPPAGTAPCGAGAAASS